MIFKTEDTAQCQAILLVVGDRVIISCPLSSVYFPAFCHLPLWPTWALCPILLSHAYPSTTPAIHSFISYESQSQKTRASLELSVWLRLAPGPHVSASWVTMLEDALVALLQQNP